MTQNRVIVSLTQREKTHIAQPSPPLATVTFPTIFCPEDRNNDHEAQPEAKISAFETMASRRVAKPREGNSRPRATDHKSATTGPRTIYF